MSISHRSDSAHEDTTTDLSPAARQFLADALAGLSKPRKTLPSKYFYDETGSQLFEDICELKEYYPTRTEMAIMERHIDEMVEALGPRCLLIEYGSGSSLKTRILLDHLIDPAGYVPIDISRDFLLQVAETIAHDYPDLVVKPVSADYTRSFSLPVFNPPPRRRIVYFPGSTIGNFEPGGALAFLRHVAEVCGEGGGLLIGVDLKKEVSVMEAAYDDARGVTAAFNKNILVRLNEELGASFDLDAFEHLARYNSEEGRVEMHLVSTQAQTAELAGRRITFEAGETIHTENSYKYAVPQFAELAARAGFEQRAVWTDEADYFSVQYLVTGSNNR